MTENTLDVAILMGSDSDLPVVSEVFKIFDESPLFLSIYLCLNK